MFNAIQTKAIIDLTSSVGEKFCKFASFVWKIRGISDVKGLVSVSLTCSVGFYLMGSGKSSEMILNFCALASDLVEMNVPSNLCESSF